MSVEKIQRDLTNLFNYPSDQNPTTQADYINAVKNWVETIVNLVDCNLWQPETEYSVGNYLRTPSLPSQVVLRCVTAGISGTEEPDYSEAEIGDTIADGSIEWTIQTMASLNELDAYFAEIIQRIENGEGVVDTMWETDLETDIQPISATNVVPKVNGTGTLGTPLKKWANVYANGLTISGTATATTPTAGDDSTKIATTEFVNTKAGDYLPLSGGTMTGAIKGDSLTLTAENGGNSASLVLNNSGSATWNSKEVERVNASGTGYIRYESGLQICWGTASGSGTSTPTEVTYPQPFSSNPVVNATSGLNTITTNDVNVQVGFINTTTFSFRYSIGGAWSNSNCRWFAIGWWK